MKLQGAWLTSHEALNCPSCLWGPPRCDYCASTSTSKLKQSMRSGGKNNYAIHKCSHVTPKFHTLKWVMNKTEQWLFQVVSEILLLLLTPQSIRCNRSNYPLQSRTRKAYRHNHYVYRSPYIHNSPACPVLFCPAISSILPNPKPHIPQRPLSLGILLLGYV